MLPNSSRVAYNRFVVTIIKLGLSRPSPFGLTIGNFIAKYGVRSV